MERLESQFKKPTCVGNSFGAATPVLMADGTTKAIATIAPADLVLATDPTTGNTAGATVTATHRHDDTELADVTVTERDGTESTIHTTSDHPFWDATRDEWVPAGQLAEGTRLYTPRSGIATVTSVNSYAAGEAMYNLTVAAVHTYYVLAGSTPVLVHNTGPCPTIKGRMRAAGPGDEFGLPSQGRIRYVPPEGYNPANPLPRGPQNGYIDRFGNEWVVGPSRTPGQPFEWDVQLSRTGREQIGWLSRDGQHVNVSPLGEVTH